jgi:hypothetical protein
LALGRLQAASRKHEPQNAALFRAAVRCSPAAAARRRAATTIFTADAAAGESASDASDGSSGRSRLQKRVKKASARGLRALLAPADTRSRLHQHNKERSRADAPRGHLAATNKAAQRRTLLHALGCRHSSALERPRVPSARLGAAVDRCWRLRASAGAHGLLFPRAGTPLVTATAGFARRAPLRAPLTLLARAEKSKELRVAARRRAAAAGLQRTAHRKAGVALGSCFRDAGRNARAPKTDAASLAHVARRTERARGGAVGGRGGQAARVRTFACGVFALCFIKHRNRLLTVLW